MDSDEIKFELIKESLKKIIRNTNILAISTLVIFLSDKKGVSLFNVSIPPNYFAISLASILFYFIISASSKCGLMIYLFESIEEESNQIKIKSYLNLYPSLLNPFAQIEEAKDTINSLFSSLGPSLHIVLIFFSTGLIRKVFSMDNYFVAGYTFMGIFTFMALLYFFTIFHKLRLIISRPAMTLKLIFAIVAFIFCFLIFINN